MYIASETFLERNNGVCVCVCMFSLSNCTAKETADEAGSPSSRNGYLQFERSWFDGQIASFMFQTSLPAKMLEPPEIFPGKKKKKTHAPREAEAQARSNAATRLQR